MTDDTELLDVLDDEDLHVVCQKPRSVVHRDHNWHGAVFVWSAWEAAGMQHMLLQQRGRPGDDFLQLVDALAGGHIGAGETAIDAVRRELMEETGLVTRADDFIHLGSHRVERTSGLCRRVLKHLFLYPVPLDIDRLRFSDEVDGFIEVDLQCFDDLVHGRRQQLPSQARFKRDSGQAQTFDLPQTAVLGYPDVDLDTFRRSLASLVTWFRDGEVDPCHFK